MSATFTDDDLDKTVENENGEVIGYVTDVEDDTARVEPRAGVVDSIRAALGWRGGEGETVTIREAHVDEVTSETVRLEGTKADAFEDESDSGIDGEDEENGDAVVDGETSTADRQPAERSTDSAAEPALESGTAAEREPGTGGDTESVAEASNAATGADESPGTIDEDETNEGEPDVRASADEAGGPTDDLEDPPGTGISGEVGAHDTSDAIDQSEVQEPAESTAEPDDVAKSRGNSNEVADPRAESDDVAEPATEPTDVAEPTDSDETTDATDSTDSMRTDVPIGDVATETEREEATSVGKLETGVDLEAAATADGEESDEDATETDDPADELDTGVDLEAAASSGSEVGTEDGDRGADGDASDADPAAEIDLGTDLEAATSSPSETDARPETSLDPDVEERPSPEADPRPENELDSAADDARNAETATQQSAGDVLATVDIESAATSARESETEPEIGPDAVAGSASDGDDDPDAVARQRVTDEFEATKPSETSSESDGVDDGERPTDSGRPTEESSAPARGRDQRRRSTPLSALLAAQRAAIETPLAAQRGSLEATQAATRGYFTVLQSMTGGGFEASGTRNRKRGRTRTADGPDEDHEDEQPLGDEALSSQLAAHLEQLRAMRDEFEAQAADGNGSEEAAAMIRRQIALLEQCRQRLDADGERPE
ncbi:midas domain-containing protein [Natronolimnohabitans innermongolicus]|uniref:ATPase AAA n=1 Tax=Natronolimnohabitans innermongolicus JCM 12255 TaxID=1227499 RepID=L9WXN8_9EURY|nr:hypothetical protein [Natronolimnohabitans innermongolicus]ELY53113.1 ATPase AAA [Natronolimnohabitans innermongolicus JCM 12255]